MVMFRMLHTLPSLIALTDTKHWNSAPGLAISLLSVIKLHRQHQRRMNAELPSRQQRRMDALSFLLINNHNKTLHLPPDKRTVRNTKKITADRRFRPPASTSKGARAPASKGVPRASNQTQQYQTDWIATTNQFQFRQDYYTTTTCHRTAYYNIRFPFWFQLPVCKGVLKTNSTTRTIDWSYDTSATRMIDLVWSIWLIAYSLLFYHQCSRQQSHLTAILQ